MTNHAKENWITCPAPAIFDTIRWREPLWDKPSKPRGKPDKIGEQMVTAQLVAVEEELAELRVVAVERLSLISGAQDAPAKMKKNDMIRRKLSSIQRGDCQKSIQE